MPMPSREPAEWPQGFDPEKHCGALTVGGKPCMRSAGAGVADYQLTGRGGGRCSNHGGRGGRPIEHGGYSAFTESFEAMVSEMKDSPDLMDLREDIAFVKIVVGHMRRDYAERLEQYYEAKSAIDAMDVTMRDPLTGEATEMMPLDLPPPPALNTELIKTLERVVKSQHEMDYARQFSIPKREVIGIVEQVSVIFGEICDQFGFSNDAKIAFANKLRGIQISKDGQTTAEARGMIKLPANGAGGAANRSGEANYDLAAG